VVLSAVLAGAPAAAQVTLVGVEFQINTYSSLSQNRPDVAALGDGFVVAWNSVHDGDELGVFASRLSSAGTRLGVELQLNVYTTDAQFNPDVAELGSGFVVTWSSAAQDGGTYGVFGRRFASDGSPIGGEFQVANRTLDAQLDSSVAAIGSGGFVVVWESLGDEGDEGIFGRRFSSSGTPQGPQFQVNSYTIGEQRVPAVARLGQGFVVVWHSQYQDGDSDGIFGQRYDSSGNELGGEFLVNNITAELQTEPAVVSSDSGFVVTWTGDDGSGSGVFGRRFDQAGVAQASEFRINTEIANSQADAELAALGSSFLVVWVENANVLSRRLDGLGLPDGPAVRVNSFTPNYQIHPSVAAVDGSGFVVAWTSQLQDGSTYGVFGRRIRVLAEFDVDGNGVVDPLTDGLLGLRYFFGFTGAALITGAVGPGCTRCTAPEIEAYMAGKV
jgi:hypothetical protein